MVCQVKDRGFKSHHFRVMLTKNQFLRRKKIKKLHKKTPALDNCPQKKGICVKIILKAPKKPNSALRKIVRLKLTNNKKVYGYIPGCGHNLQEYSTVLIKGGRVKDLPGVKYHLIRNKFDLNQVKNRKTSRSKYGVKKIKVNFNG